MLFVICASYQIILRQLNDSRTLIFTFDLFSLLLFIPAGCGNQPGVQGQPLGLCQWGEATHKHWRRATVALAFNILFASRLFSFSLNGLRNWAFYHCPCLMCLSVHLFVSAALPVTLTLTPSDPKSTNFMILLTDHFLSGGGCDYDVVICCDLIFILTILYFSKSDIVKIEEHSWLFTSTKYKGESTRQQWGGYCFISCFMNSSHFIISKTVTPVKALFVGCF